MLCRSPQHMEKPCVSVSRQRQLKSLLIESVNLKFQAQPPPDFNHMEDPKQEPPTKARSTPTIVRDNNRKYFVVVLCH